MADDEEQRTGLMGINARWLSLGLCFGGGATSYAASPELSAEVKSPDPTALSVTLNDASQIALGKSPKLHQAEAERNAATEHRRGSWAQVGPKVTADYAETRFSQPINVDFAPGQTFVVRPTVIRSEMLTVSQPITGAYALVTKAKFDGEQEDVKQDALKLTRSDVAFQASDSWLRAYQAQKQLEIAEFAVNVAKSQAKDGDAMERAGRLNHADALKLQLSISEARSTAAQARAVRDITFAGLRETLGLPVGAKLALAGALPTVPEPPSETDAVAKAMDLRVEKKQAEAGVKLANYGTKLAYAQYIPTVNVFARSEHDVGPLPFGSQAWTHSYGVTASWDLWTNGSSAFAVREAAQTSAAAEQAQLGVEQMVRLDVQQSLANLNAARESAAAATLAVSQAEEVYRIEQVRFKTGTVLISDLLLVENSREGAKARLVNAETDLVAWHLKTQKALGLEQPQL